MKLNRIIREEIGDFDWTSEVSPLDPILRGSGQFKIWLGETSFETQNKALQTLYDNGYRWPSENGTETVEEMGLVIVSLYLDAQLMKITYSGYSPELDEYGEDMNFYKTYFNNNDDYEELPLDILL